MALIVLPGIKKTKLTAQLKAWLCIALQLFLIVSVSGCTKLEDKTFAGTTQGEFNLNYALTFKYSGQDKVTYQLKVTATDNDQFTRKITERWLEETGLKHSAYGKLSEYCKLNPDAAACFNINDVTKDIESQDISLFYQVKIQDNNKKQLESISGKFGINLKSQDDFPKNPLIVEGVIALSREEFAKIASVELQVK